MIKTYKLEQGQVVEAPDGSGPVLFVTSPTPEERARLVGEMQIDEHNLNSTADPNELPRLELDNNHLAVIFKEPKPYSAHDNLQFLINAVGLFLFRDKLVIVAPQDKPPFQGRMFTRVQNLQMLFLRILSECVSHFVAHLKVINEVTNELESKLATAMENRSLLLMFTIEKSLVYYVNAISANGLVIEKLKANAKNSQTEGLTPEMLDYVDDLAIENAQCLEQARVYANVITGLMDARASIVNNNLNILMKRLTVINVVFMPINLLASIGGMSEYSMMTQGVHWAVSYGLFGLAMILIGYGTYAILRFSEQKTLCR
ncbi:MAG TPA: magnesium transporter CorA family protein [Candidatus Brocadiia bacterium]|nr:magnesium transporter CorA family protein [Candidatus Brocadiia bacterium]